MKAVTWLAGLDLSQTVPAVAAPEVFLPTLPAVDSVATSHAALQRIEIPAREGRSFVPQLFRSLASEGDGNTTTLSNATFLFNRNYVTTLTVDKQDFQVIVDTGSSDTWLVTSDYVCYDEYGTPAAAEYCGFGPGYVGNYTEVPNSAVFAIRYGDETQVAGHATYKDVTLAGQTIKSQEIAFITEAVWAGDGVTSGTMGLSYPITTRVFNSSEETFKYPGSPTHQKYDPVFTSMYKQNLSSAVFSLAMNRTAKMGWLSFGGLPPVAVKPDYAKTAIRIVEADNAAALKTELSYYTVVPDGFILGSLNTSTYNYNNTKWTASSYADVKSSQFPVIIDSGTTLSMLPEAVARNYARQVPAPVAISEGNYWALCSHAGNLPKFGITFGGKTFWWRDEDLLMQDIKKSFRMQNGETGEFCALGLMDVLPDGPYILGDNFLNGLVSVFDVGTSEMRFYEKE